MDNYYLGTTPKDNLGSNSRYLVALRRNDDGELFFVIVDQIADRDAEFEVNQPGAVEDNFPDFEQGIDYFEGILADHEKEYLNMLYTQYKWSARPLFYYVDSQGQLVQRSNKSYLYPDGTSSSGIENVVPAVGGLFDNSTVTVNSTILTFDRG